MPEENIREYNFAVPGNIDRHIPGIPGTWPFGSFVTVNEDTKEIIAVRPEGAAPVVPGPVEEEPAKQAEPVPETPPAVDNQPTQVALDPAQQLSDAVANL